MNGVKVSLSALAFVFATLPAMGGNPDRQGEAGAYELLMNPWARSIGLHAMSTSLVRGVEAMQINVAGMGRINGLEVGFGQGLYLQGTDIRLNAAGLSRKVGSNGAFGIHLMAVDFGEIPVTTVNQPEGTGATFSPNFFNIGFGYSHVFENRVSVGVLLRGISETLSNVAAFGFAVDAGVQYVTGPKDNFKFGISLRNVGSPMAFRGEALSVQRPSPNGGAYQLTLEQRSARFELPSLLSIGLSQDLYPSEAHRITLLGNFTSNSFSRDQLGVGVEYALQESFMLRGGYNYEMGVADETQAPVYAGPSAGASIEIPLSRENRDARLAIDYGYAVTRIWQGTHNVSVRINL
ncbi:MAG: hypothetical protein RL181_668 [Bacteroidota bacterium]|jgi:hypothetical protein